MTTDPTPAYHAALRAALVELCARLTTAWHPQPVGGPYRYTDEGQRRLVTAQIVVGEEPVVEVDDSGPGDVKVWLPVDADQLATPGYPAAEHLAAVQAYLDAAPAE